MGIKGGGGGGEVKTTLLQGEVNTCTSTQYCVSVSEYYVWVYKDDDEAAEEGDTDTVPKPQ